MLGDVLLGLVLVLVLVGRTIEAGGLDAIVAALLGCRIRCRCGCRLLLDELL